MTKTIIDGGEPITLEKVKAWRMSAVSVPERGRIDIAMSPAHIDWLIGEVEELRALVRDTPPLAQRGRVDTERAAWLRRKKAVLCNDDCAFDALEREE